ncbi:MAG: hypothetical protein ACK457_09945 [Flavobacteriia bacterium]
MKGIVYILLFLFAGNLLGQIQYGTNDYIEYHPGDLPIVISVPHGGSMQPSSIPDRTCNSPTLVTDAYTIELAKQIDSSLYDVTGCHPHIIYCNLKRTKLDCNRNQADGTCGDPAAETAWTEFHQFIDVAQTVALAQHGEKVFYVDLHGHGNPVQRLELGYLLYEDELELPDNVLNAMTYVGYSSIQHLVATNMNGLTHVELLRGTGSLGTLFANNGFPAVPSQQDPYPGLTSNYFSGGYNTVVHTCYQPGNVVDGVQMECNYSGVRDSYLNRRSFGAAFASVFNTYLELHNNTAISSNCGMLELDEDVPNEQSVGFFYSNGQETISLDRSYSNTEFIIMDQAGSRVYSGKLNDQKIIVLPRNLTSGFYFLILENDKFRKRYRFCIFN